MSEIIPTFYVTYDKADQSTIDERESICNSCDDFISESSICSICHCSQYKKWTLIESKCPAGKWSDVSWAMIRDQRNTLLADTDFYALSDVTMSEEIETYRQALRDITETYTSPEDVIWPEKP